MSRPLLLTGPWRPLVDHAGGVTALAAELGTSRASLIRWINGRLPAPIVREAVSAWARRRGLEPPWPKTLRELRH